MNEVHLVFRCYISGTFAGEKVIPRYNVVRFLMDCADLKIRAVCVRYFAVKSKDSKEDAV